MKVQLWTNHVEMDFSKLKHAQIEHFDVVGAQRAGRGACCRHGAGQSDVIRTLVFANVQLPTGWLLCISMSMH